MDTRLAEALVGDARDWLTIAKSRVADPERLDEDLIPAFVARDTGADDSVIVVMLDEDERADIEGDGGDDGEGWDDGGDDGDGAQLPLPARQPELSDERRDRIIVMMVAALAAGAALLIGGIVLAGALGWIQPACGGILVTHTATCRGATQSYTTVDPAITPDWSRYRLDTPAVP